MREYENLNDYEFDNYSGRGFGGGSLAAMLLGMGVGAALAMLFAPQSGVETRDMIRRRYRDTVDNLGERANEFRERGSEWVNSAGEKVKPFARKVAEATGQGERFDNLTGGNVATGTTGTGNVGGSTGTNFGTTGTGTNRPSGGGTTGGGSNL